MSARRGKLCSFQSKVNPWIRNISTLTSILKAQSNSHPLHESTEMSEQIPGVSVVRITLRQVLKSQVDLVTIDSDYGRWWEWQRPTHSGKRLKMWVNIQARTQTQSDIRLHLPVHSTMFDFKTCGQKGQLRKSKAWLTIVSNEDVLLTL